MTLDECIPDGTVFSLTCEQCDAGMDIACYDQALAEGWTNIGYDPGGLAWNYVGLCPDCRRAEETLDRERGVPDE